MMPGGEMPVGNVIAGFWLGLLALLVTQPAHAGALTGAILDEGLSAEIVDVMQLPSSAGSAPLARVNMLKEAPDGSGRLFVNDLPSDFAFLVALTLQTSSSNNYGHATEHLGKRFIVPHLV
jgi:hypothetical protein